MKMRSGMKDNLRFDGNENTKRADAAFSITMRKFMLDVNVRNYTMGYDEDTEDVLYFFPLYEIDKWKKEDRQRYFAEAIYNWRVANFEIVEQKEMSGEEYFHVGFASLFFRLRSLI